MKVLLVRVHVKPECLEEFRAATIENARNSATEPGIARFDFVQERDDPKRFMLIEVYRSQEATLAHKETAHYLAWRAAVEPMMAGPRVGTWTETVFPGDEAW